MSSLRRTYCPPLIVQNEPASLHTQDREVKKEMSER